MRVGNGFRSDLSFVVAATVDDIEVDSVAGWASMIYRRLLTSVAETINKYVACYKALVMYRKYSNSAVSVIEGEQCHHAVEIDQQTPRKCVLMSRVPDFFSINVPEQDL